MCLPKRTLALILCHSLPPLSSIKGFQIAPSFWSGFQDQTPNIRPLTQYLPTICGLFPSFLLASFTTQYLSPKVSVCKGYRASLRKAKFSLDQITFLTFLLHHFSSVNPESKETTRSFYFLLKRIKYYLSLLLLLRLFPKPISLTLHSKTKPFINQTEECLYPTLGD